MRAAPELAAGVASLPAGGSALAATQATWRFLGNERVTLTALMEPLREVGRKALQTDAAPFAMLVHDWSKLSFDHPKQDEVQLTHQSDVGYELTSALLVSAEDGAPVAPLEMHLRTADGVLSTRSPAPKRQAHLDQILPTMQAAQQWNLSKPLLHVIDREADSVDHYRRWDAAGVCYLIRADERRVRQADASVLLSEIVVKLGLQRQFSNCGPALYQGRAAQLWVAEDAVVLDRPAKKNVAGQRFSKAGRPLALRLIVAQLRDDQDQVLAQWWLLSNAPVKWADAGRLARCYYWRWRIESFFKLLKSHGQQLEHWQQETGPAIARRLLVAAMACVVVWQLQADASPPAQELKTLLIRLSGRQMKRGRPCTAPALLAGLWTLLSMLAALEHVDLQQIKTLAQILPFHNTS